MSKHKNEHHAVETAAEAEAKPTVSAVDVAASEALATNDVVEGEVFKGGQNPPNTSEDRPSPPQGSQAATGEVAQKSEISPLVAVMNSPIARRAVQRYAHVAEKMAPIIETVSALNSQIAAHIKSASVQADVEDRLISLLDSIASEVR